MSVYAIILPCLICLSHLTGTSENSTIKVRQQKNPVKGLQQMITSQDIEKMTVSELRKLASQKGLTHIPCDRPEKADANGQIRTGHANRVELLAVLTPQKQLELSMFQLTDEELVEVESAMEVSKMSLLELAKAGLLLKARRINTDYSKVASLTPEQRKQTTLAGAANAIF
jgi:hypothetical protein